MINIKSASDIAGGPRQDLLIVVDRDGSIVQRTTAEAIGTLQAVAAGFGAAIISAGGQAAGSALVRPARNQTNVRMDVAGTGGAGGTSTATSNPAASSTSSTSSNAQIAPAGP